MIEHVDMPIPKGQSNENGGAEALAQKKSFIQTCLKAPYKNIAETAFVAAEAITIFSAGATAAHFFGPIASGISAVITSASVLAHCIVDPRGLDKLDIVQARETRQIDKNWNRYSAFLHLRSLTMEMLPRRMRTNLVVHAISTGLMTCTAARSARGLSAHISRSLQWQPK